VKIFRYVTESSFDSYIWQTLRRKPVSSIDDDERIVEVEKDTGQIVHIPLRRIIEVLPAVPPHNLPTLVLNGQLLWFPETQRWRFVE
jgi:hypothetical protein